MLKELSSSRAASCAVAKSSLLSNHTKGRIRISISYCWIRVLEESYPDLDRYETRSDPKPIKIKIKKIYFNLPGKDFLNARDGSNTHISPRYRQNFSCSDYEISGAG